MPFQKIFKSILGLSAFALLFGCGDKVTTHSRPVDLASVKVKDVRFLYTETMNWTQTEFFTSANSKLSKKLTQYYLWQRPELADNNYGSNIFELELTPVNSSKSLWKGSFQSTSQNDTIYFHPLEDTTSFRLAKLENQQGKNLKSILNIFPTSLPRYLQKGQKWEVPLEFFTLYREVLGENQVKIGNHSYKTWSIKETNSLESGESIYEYGEVGIVYFKSTQVIDQSVDGFAQKRGQVEIIREIKLKP